MRKAARVTGSGRKTSAAMPAKVEPMLATLSKEFPKSNDWTFEIKWDGYRIIACVTPAGTRLLTRSNLDFTKNYPVIADAFTLLKAEAIIDGELVVLNEEGQPDFDALQRYSPEMNIVFYAFDLIWFEGKSLEDKTLEERKLILRKIIPDDNPLIRYSEDFDDGEALFKQAETLGLEGVVAKKKDSVYQQGKRTKNWLKLPTAIRQEFVIGGWSVSESRKFRSLIFGYYENKKLLYLGHAGLGFKQKDMPEILQKLKTLETKKNPFANKVDVDAEIRWIKPKLVAEIKYATLTDSGKIRKPAVFLGFRQDKPAEEVHKEVDVPVEDVEEKPDVVTSKFKLARNHIKLSPESNWKTILSQPLTSSDTVEIDGKEVLLQNVEKEIWHGITKADLISYYHQVSSYMLPYLQDRPQSMHIKHAGVTRPGLYIKDMEGQQPQWAEIFSIKRKHKKAGRRDIIDYLVCNDEATLLYMVNLGCIDINPWTARTTDPFKPDFIIIDLDPSDDDFNKVIKTAVAAKTVLDRYKLIAFAKTSGKTGLHIYIPCSDFSFPEARIIAEKLCEEIHDVVPDFTTTEVSVSQRGDRLYIDPNQNDEADTVAAPYSARPHHLPTVSTPLEWKEITAKLDPSKFTIKTILNRIEKKGDIFKGVLEKKNAIKNNKILKGFL